MMKASVKYLYFSLGLFLFLAVFKQASAQQQDTIANLLADQLAQQIERIAEETEDILDYSDLLEEYYFYLENPVNINSPAAIALRDMYLISAFQYQQLQDYIKSYGRLVDVNELVMVEGFDSQTLALLKPIVIATEVVERQKIKPSTVLRWGRHQLLMRAEQTLEEQAGYAPISDSALHARPTARYLGSPQKLYARYSFNYRNRVRAGVTMEKDQGEAFFRNNVNDSLQRILGDKLRNGFDFYSAHLYLADMGIVRQLAIGDYHLAFGQGLTLWSGLSFGKSTEATKVMKFGAGIRPNTSVNENIFLRGAATTLGYKNFELSAFYSSNNIDANISQTDSLSDELLTISSLQESGLHRTVNELLNKEAIKQQLIGGRLAYRSTRFELGFTMHQTTMGAELIPRIYPYNQYRFTGTNLMNQGLDFKVIYPSFMFFGEISRSDNGGMAGIAGLTAQPAAFVEFTLVYRDYAKEYQNLFSNGFSEGSQKNNERGIYAGVNVGLSPRWRLSAFADHFSHEWLRFQADAPNYGHDYFVQLDHRLTRRSDFYIRFRTKQKMKNDRDPWNRIDYLVDYTKNSYRFHINYAVSESFTFKNRAELISYTQQNKTDSYGFVIYHDVLFRPPAKSYQLTFRYAIFDADTYDSRLYMYENDVLYAFSIPAFYQKGSRMYLLLRWQISKSLDLWARLAQTWYANRPQIGTGLEMIDGNVRTDAKVQLRWRF
jgi:hypothetical protein